MLSQGGEDKLQGPDEMWRVRLAVKQMSADYVEIHGDNRRDDSLHMIPQQIHFLRVDPRHTNFGAKPVMWLWKPPQWEESELRVSLFSMAK